jgi:hypothetical protein
MLLCHVLHQDKIKIFTHYKMNVSTNFLNSKMRRIFVSAAGKYFSKADDGKRTYKPKAAFRKVGANGSMNKLTKSNTVPTPIRPAMIAGRKTRKNAGGMRMTEARGFQMIFPGNAAKKVRQAAAPDGCPEQPSHRCSQAQGWKEGCQIRARQTRQLQSVLRARGQEEVNYSLIN